MQKRTYNKRAKEFSTEKIIGKTLPFSVEAERAILGALLINDENILRVSEYLMPSDFYTNAHKIIYKTISEIHESNKRVDLITLQDELEKKDHLEDIGGVLYLVSLQEDISAVGLVEQHTKIIKEKAILRELITSATSIITNCYSQNDKGIEAVLDEAEQTIFDIANKRLNKSFVQLDIWLKKTFKQLSEIKNHGSGITGIPSGYEKLDEISSGFQNGDFIVLAARPSMGKTALSLQFALNAAEAGYRVGFFSIEMSAEQLVLRLLSAKARVYHHSIRNKTISSNDWNDLIAAAAELAQSKLFIDDAPMQTIMDIRTKARKLKIEHNVDCIIIDYLQLLHGSGRYENRHQEVSSISRSLKALAKELNIPVIALSQLSRAVESRIDKRPQLSDLRESGAIEQDADLIMFLYRDIVYNQDTEDPNLAELIIGKQRNGPTGTVFLNFQREYTSFEDILEE